MPPEMNTAGAEIITTAWLDQRFEPRRIVTAMPKEATEAEKPFVYLKPASGTILMWESWLRHEVPANRAEEQRISIRFNYA